MVRLVAGSRSIEARAVADRKHARDIEIVRNGREATVFLYINGHHAAAHPKMIALLDYLFDRLGKVITYKQLCSVLGCGYDHRRQLSRRLLRQYAYEIKRTLEKYEAPYMLTVAANVGYALCEAASP